MRRYLLGIMVILLSLVPAVVGYGAENFYVQSEKAKVMWKPSFSAEVMDIVSKGHEFKNGVRTGSWIRVSHNMEVGYVPALLVSNRPPFAKVSLIKASNEELAFSTRRRASTYTSAAAARGLTQEGRSRLSREDVANYGAIDKIESFTPTADDLQKFLEGRPL